MAKKISNRGQRRKIERNIQKGKKESNTSSENLLYRIKYELTSIQSEQLINSLSDEQFIQVIGEKLPKTYNQLRGKGLIYPANQFNKELLWYKNFIIDYADEINSFLKFQEEFESAFIKNEFQKAWDIVINIESEICVSHWSIEKKLLLAEYQFGFKTNKEVLTQIISDNTNVITDIVAKYHSIKVEKNLSYIKYLEMVSHFINNYSDPQVTSYLNYKLNFYSQLSYQFKGFILNAESSSSIIDMYIAFINVITMATSENSRDTNEITTISHVLNLLNDVIKDNRIKFALSSIGEVPSFQLNLKDESYQDILNNYSIGNYLISKERASEFLKTDAACFELYEIYVKSCIHLNEVCNPLFAEGSVGNALITDIYNILQKNSETQNSIYNIHKLFNTIGLNAWSYKAFAFFNNQHSISGTELNIAKFSHTYGNFINPMLSIYLNVKQSSIQFLNCIRLSSNKDLINFWANISSQLHSLNVEQLPNDVQDFRKRLYNIHVLQVKGGYKDALEGYNSILSNKLNGDEQIAFYNREEILHGLLYCYLNLGDMVNALELVTDSNLKNPNLSIRLRNEFLINFVITSESEQLAGNISTAIFLHQYQKYISNNDLWIAYDNFLNSHGLNYPKEIEGIINGFDLSKLIYFLKNICKQEVYDSSYLFESQEDLDNERIEVCLLLSKLDKSNLEDYINEVAEISRNQLIRKGIKQIDESKIYVDIKGIRKAIDKDLKESFYRSLNLLSLPLSQIQKLDTSNDNVVVPYYGKSNDNNKVEFNTSNIKITTYSRFEQFKDMFFKVRDIFIASNEFGIDTYLSMRIRHGTLLGEIRSVFENYQLLTKKVDNSDKYQDNTFWLQKNLFNSEAVRDNFNKYLSEFSSQIDNISNNLKNKLLQISTEKKKSDGLFDYSFYENDLLALFESDIGAIEDYDEFFDTIINFLWERTEIALSIIREEISESVKNNMIKLLSDLSKNLESLISKYEHPELNELVNNITLCQTDIANELDKISEWFRRTNNKVINEFYLDLPIDASLATLKRLYKDFTNFNPVITNNCSIKFEGDTFPHFTYIMQNLLHNIIRHSRLDSDALDVNIIINELDSQLSLVIESNFSDTINIEEMNQRIENTRQQLLMQTQDNDRTRDEGGTGYVKIKKTVVSDLLRDEHTITLYNVDESRRFKSEIQFDISTLQKVNNESIIN